MKQYSTIERAWLWLNRVVKTNIRVTEALINANGGILNLYEQVKAGKDIVTPPTLDEKELALLRSSATEDSIDRYAVWLDRKKINAVTRDSDNYPNLLREIHDPPTVLYVRGKLNCDIKLPFAIIGSRKCTRYGVEMAELFGHELAKRGFTIISGMAVGCDSAASRGALRALDNDLPTIAVLGSGVDVIYPESSAELYYAIVERGAVISEYLPTTEPNQYTFIPRNRIISGLAMGLLVVEASERSGTSTTVGFAHDQGRDVFSIPARLTDRSSAGTNALIKSGSAKPVFDVEDIIFEYGLPLEANPISPIKALDIQALPHEQRKIYEILSYSQRDIDELCELTGLSAADLSMHLTEMEFSGIIKQLSHRMYSV